MNPPSRWAVRVPVFNGAKTLGATLESVLAAIGIRDDVSIEVVDDASTDATSQVAAAFSPRVSYFRAATNQGAIPTFNTCIDRANAEFLHILHADDVVWPGFYERAEAGYAVDTVAATTCRTHFVDATGTVVRTSRSEREGDGPWTDALTTLTVSNRVYASATTFRVTSLADIGVFDETLPHVADWDMWHRLAASATVWYVDSPLAGYRVHPGQDTATRMRSGANIVERREAIEKLIARVPPERRRRLHRQALGYSALYAGRTALKAMSRRESSTARRQLVEAARCAVAAVGV